MQGDTAPPGAALQWRAMMITLTADECRVLGTLVEKAQTVATQYPLSLVALVTGCNQKNNRDPHTNLTEDDVLTSVGALRNKGLVREVLLSGSRVHKYRHLAREALEVSTAELVILAELLLRGPQAAGELRGRAQRMMPDTDRGISTLEGAQAVLEGLARRDEPFVRRLTRRPGERAERWMQLLCPDLHPLDGPLDDARVGSREEEAAALDAGGSVRAAELALRVEELEREVAGLRDAMRKLASEIGAANPFERG